MNRQSILPRHLAGSAILAVTISMLGACASSGPGGGGGYSQEMAELERGCTARGGILTPIPGANTGRPATDYACTIRGGATRVEP